MARRRKSNGTKPAGPTWGERFRRALGAVALRLGLVVLVVGIVWFLLREVDTYAARVDEFRVNLATLTLSNPPEWVDEQIERQIMHLEGLPESVSLVDEDVAMRVFTSFQVNPWIKTVHYVRKDYPNSLEISMDVRTPVAFVKCGDYFYLSDSEGVRLPGRWSSWPDARFPHLPFVYDSNYDAAPQLVEPGERWREKSTRAGLAVGRELSNAGIKDYDKYVRIMAIDVGGFYSSRRDKCEIVLYTNKGVRINFGREPGCDDPGVLPARQRIDNILLAARNGDLNNAELLDVRFDPPPRTRGSGDLHMLDALLRTQ